MKAFFRIQQALALTAYFNQLLLLLLTFRIKMEILCEANFDLPLVNTQQIA